MGGAIVRGLVKGSIFKPEDIFVSDVNQDILDTLKKDIPGLNVELDSYSSVSSADIVFVARAKTFYTKSTQMKEIIKNEFIKNGMI